jgi:hypothetical protein
MPKCLRFSEDYIQWEYDRNRIPWLEPEEIPADLLNDLITSDNRLSLWLITDDNTNIDRILAARGANKISLVEVGFVLFDFSIIEKLNINYKNSDGRLPDKDASKEWHFDLLNLSAEKLVKLAEIILQNGHPKMITEDDKYGLIAKSIKNGFLNKEKLDKFIQKRVDPYLF